MQAAALVEHIEVRVLIFSIEMNAHAGLAHMQVMNEKFWKPIRQMWIKQQQIGWGKWVKT